jgi:hypothetical protein
MVATPLILIRSAPGRNFGLIIYRALHLIDHLLQTSQRETDFLFTMTIHAQYTYIRAPWLVYPMTGSICPTFRST